MSASQQERTRARDRERARARRANLTSSQRDRARQLNNLSVSAIAPIKKSAEQVKHRKNANEDESAIVFGTSDNWKKKTQEEQEARQERNRLRYERQLEKKPRSNGKRAKSAIVFVNMKVEP
ncbi:hypothetical protein PC120_g25002 [Phytophthora cactorum]|nr:hypothetical protein PC120_g25002 [Phytophthora cactorum]